MLAKKYRLTKEKDFSLIFKKGKRIFGRYLSVSYLPTGLPDSRFAVVVANKISKKATKRNTVKRKIREIIRLNLKTISPVGDFVINVLSTGLDADYAVLEKDFLQVIKKI